MNFSDMVRQLLPSFDRGRMLDDLSITRSEIREFTAPAYHVAVSTLHNWKIKDENIKNDNQVFMRLVKKSSGNMFVTIDKEWKQVLSNLDYVEELIRKTGTNEYSASGLSYKRANIIQFLSYAAFVSKYARKYVSYVFLCETASYEGTEAMSKLTPSSIEWLRVNFVNFCTAYNALTFDTNKVIKAFDDIPELVINPDNEKTMASIHGQSKLDPFSIGIIPIWGNPVYHIGMAIAEWQSARYKAAKEELQQIQLRKLNLERVSQGKPDARIQKELDRINERVEELEYKIDKMEGIAK